MPISPANRALYPPNWKAISLLIRRDRAGWQCEAVIDNQRCQARHGQPHPVTGKRVVLQCAHLNHAPDKTAYHTIAAYCDRCHLRYDAQHHAANAAVTRSRKKNG